MWDIKFLIRDLLRQPSFQAFINARYKDDNRIIMDKDAVMWFVRQVTGVDLDIGHYASGDDILDYRFHEIRNDDVVLDIGAGAGLFSMLAARIARKVYYIEPLIGDIASENIRKSGLQDKIQALPFAFGGNGTCVCNFWGYNSVVESHDLAYILDIVPDITVVKSDCEGGEWGGFLSCKDFKSVRKIDMEYHIHAGDGDIKLNELELLLNTHGFSINCSRDGASKTFGYTGLIHAVRYKGCV